MCFFSLSLFLFRLFFLLLLTFDQLTQFAESNDLTDRHVKTINNFQLKQGDTFFLLLRYGIYRLK